MASSVSLCESGRGLRHHFTLICFLHMQHIIPPRVFRRLVGCTPRYIGPYVGFRLLTSSLQLVSEAEVVVDLSRSEGWITKKGGHHDCRLQVPSRPSFTPPHRIPTSPHPSPSPPKPPHPAHPISIPAHATPSHSIPSHPIPSHPIPSHPILAGEIQTWTGLDPTSDPTSASFRLTRASLVPTTGLRRLSVPELYPVYLLTLQT